MVDGRKVRWRESKLSLSCRLEQLCFWARCHLVTQWSLGACWICGRNSVIHCRLPTQPDIIRLQHSPTDFGTSCSTILTGL